jgi:general secretion pathway protein F
MRRPSAADRAAALRHLATLVGAGLPVAEALDGVAEQTEHPALVHALVTARARLAEGASLAAALGASPRVFPPLVGHLVRAAEESGALVPVLGRLAAHTEAAAETRARLRGALTYPAVMALATAAVVAFLLAWVVPQVTRLFAETGARLPLATRLLVGVTDLVAATWWLLLVGGAALAFGARAWLVTPAGRTWRDRTVLRLPVAGTIAAKAAVARLARTLATLLAGGVPLETALGVGAEAAGNRVIADAALAVRDAVGRGEALAPALRRCGVFPPLLVRLAATGEASGTLADGLERAAVAYDAEVGRAVATATALVEPLLILVTGGVVLLLVAAILLPLFELNALVR